MTPLEKLKEAAEKAFIKYIGPVNWVTGFIAGAQSEEARGLHEPKWIPVSERLPDRSGEYLATNDRGAIVIASFAYEGWYHIVGCTHWQPLPPLPPSPTTT